MNKLILCIILFYQVLTGYHEYFVSVTEITYNPEKQRIEIISRLFYDDFENALKHRYSEDIEINPYQQSENVENYITDYFNKKLKLSIHSKQHTLSYLGYKFEEDRINVFFEINNIAEYNSISISNLLLTDYVEKQNNIVHCFKQKQKQSSLLTRYNYEAVFNFN